MPKLKKMMRTLRMMMILELSSIGPVASHECNLIAVLSILMVQSHVELFCTQCAFCKDYKAVVCGDAAGFSR